MSESEFEAELRALRPARPSAALEAAIAGELGRSRAVAVRPAAGLIVRQPRAVSWLRDLGWACGGAAFAGLCFAFFVPVSHPVVPTLPATAVQVEMSYFEPVVSARQVLATETSEVFYDGDDGPAQVVRYSSVERHRWTNPETGALVEVEVPREDVVLVPVSYQ